MAEAVKYLVVCSCTGNIEPVAYLDDHRPAEHPLSALRGMIAVTSRSSQKILTGGIAALWAVPADQAVAAFAEKNLTETFWGDGHRMVTLRCLRCPKQAQMSYPTLVRVADRLAAQLGALAAVPVPAADDPSVTVQRHIVPLGVLCSMASPQDR